MLKVKIKENGKKLELKISVWTSSKRVLFAKIEKRKCQKILPSGVTLSITFYKYEIFFNFKIKKEKFLRPKDTIKTHCHTIISVATMEQIQKKIENKNNDFINYRQS